MPPTVSALKLLDTFRAAHVHLAVVTGEYGEILGLVTPADILRINYGDIPAVGNPIDCLFTGCQLGGPDGAGFGWRNTTVYKLGISYAWSPQLTLRGRGGFRLRRPA